jgi:eukaryotic-like serine/threonine-protein kinase
MALTDAFVLPGDVVLVPVSELPTDLRRQLNCDESDYPLTRPQSRSTSKVVDASAAGLLDHFRKPCTFVQAVVAFSRANQGSPEAILEAAFPLIHSLLESGLLVPADSDRAKAVTASFQRGDSVAGGKVLGLAHIVEDTELYQVELPEGQAAALKIGRALSGSGRDWAIRNETAILRHLDGDPAPRLLASGSLEDRPYILMEWCSGLESAIAAQRLRYARASDGGQSLRDLCTNILKAYAKLHERRVLQVDVHPRNVLVGDGQAVRIIDFGYACMDLDQRGQQYGRPGLAFFFEPEYAVAARSGLQQAGVSRAGEQYSLAALLYSLVTGSNYLDFSLDRGKMLRQLAEDAPLPFTARGVPAWPELEAILQRALQKNPADRFSSVAEFAAAVQNLGKQAGPSPPAATLPDAAPAERLLERVIRELGADGPLSESVWADAPSCSVNSGAAGYAYALYRIACARGEPGLLSLADMWATQARAHMDTESAFFNAALDMTPEMVGRISPYHTASGIHAVQALISLAMGDPTTAQEAVESFIRAADQPCENLDLTLGRSGVVLVCALLKEALAGHEFPVEATLTQLADRVLAGIWEELSDAPAMEQAQQFSFLGIAHGWAGVLYATLRWARVTGQGLPDPVAPRLEELAGKAKFTSNGGRRCAHWTRNSAASAAADPREYWPGWCAGSAGYIHLWTIASETLQEPKSLELAAAAANGAWDDPAPIGDLCCGISGRAYGLLNLYKRTGEHSLLDRARELADQAALAIAQYSLRRASLYKGEIGVGLLAADLERPELAAMPFFEHEGWPLRRGI